MKVLKKITALFLALLFLLSPVANRHVFAEDVRSGSDLYCDWTVSYSGSGDVLYITPIGTGPMKNYTDLKNPPWWSFADSIRGIDILEGITSVGDYSFCDCFSAGWVHFPSTLTRIGKYAFRGCSSLVSFTFPENLNTIDDYAFKGCTSLTNIAVPVTVTSLGGGVFAGCKGLYNLSVAEGNPYYHSDGNCIIKTSSKTLVAGCTQSVIPKDGSVTSIGEGAFFGSNISQISIPDSVTSVGDFAFSECSSAQSVSFGTGLKSVGDSAFAYCSNVKGVTIPLSVTSIGTDAFAGCSALTDVWFEGTETQRNKMLLGSGNELLIRANWHYKSCLANPNVAENHMYDGVCDADCNVCGLLRDAHTYEDVCDTICNDCGQVRVAPHAYSVYGADEGRHWLQCSLCHQADPNSTEDHVYDAACDPDCNVCDAIRSTQHDFSLRGRDENEHWMQCSMCGGVEEESRENHAYDDSCDTVCNTCAWERTIAHTFDNACDAECNICGQTREPSAHVYDNACDSNCNACNAFRETVHYSLGAEAAPAHTVQSTSSYPFVKKYGSWYYSSNQNVHSSSSSAIITAKHDCQMTILYDVSSESKCDYLRIMKNFTTIVQVSGSVYGGRKTLSMKKGDTLVVGYVKDASGSYGDDQASFSIESCGCKVLVPSETLEPTCTEPVVCVICSETLKAELGHSYDSLCDPECNTCGEVRTAPHDYSVRLHDAENHWMKCSLCESVDEDTLAAHVFDFECDGDCNVCGMVRETGHRSKIVVSAAAHELTNDAEYPFVLSDGWYVSTNKGGDSSSTFTITARHDCKIILHYKASSQSGSDRLVIEKWGTELASASGESSEQVLEIPMISSEAIFITYSKNLLISSGDDCGSFKIDFCSCTDYDFVPSETAIPTCTDPVTCFYCGLKFKDALGHSYDDDCDESCNICGETRTDVHDYSVMDQDAENHWMKCSLCGAVDENTRATHVFDNGCDSICNVCGQIRKAEHYTKIETSPNAHKKENHIQYPYALSDGWYVSTNKEHSSVSAYFITANHACDLTIRYKVSSAPGDTFTIQKREYLSTNEEKLDAISGEVAEKSLTVSLKSGDRIAIVYRKDSSTSSGSDCGSFKIDPCTCIVYKYVLSETVAPTCIEPVACTYCGLKIKDALGHSYDGDCDENCNTCGEVRTVDHDYVTMDRDTENHWMKCSLCGAADETTRAAHVYDSDLDCECNVCCIFRPDAPIIEALSATSVTLVSVFGYEYSLDGILWQENPVFSDLAPLTAYTFYQRVAKTDHADASDESVGTKVTTPKIKPGAPSAPETESVTATTVVLVNSSSCEYSLDGVTWQRSATFENLKPGSTYTFYSRFFETAEYAAGDISEGTQVTTPKLTQSAPSAPIAQEITAFSVTLVANENTEYSKDGVTWQSSPIFSGLEPVTDYTFYQRFAETDTYDASEASVAYAVCTPKAPQIAPQAPVLVEVTVNSVQLQQSEGMEYSIDGVNWQSEALFENLTDNTEYTFYQRLAGTETHLASPTSAPLEVRTNEIPPTPGDLDRKDGITMDDAIYLLYHTNFPDDYPVNQSVDFDRDGKEDASDAIYLLFYVFFPERYSLQ
ncbi:MAG: hypothetical protein E7580_02080 [Ruminococcaceae bacterium]|nr:hypothetical protein [Oscillospiraceae bacterium]